MILCPPERLFVCTFVFIALSAACASSNKNLTTGRLEQGVGSEENKSIKIDMCKNKVLVYPPNDIAMMKKNGDKTTGNPTEYCNE